MLFGLKETEVEKIKSIFNKYTQIKEAYIYGSRAKGNYHPGSDIDIALKGKEINLELLNKISLELDDLLLPQKFDISIYHHIKNTELLEHINRVGKKLYP
ncbi:MAG: nucleotidyltransferase domain-containing protein [Spirochaetia bacterium]|nr:nucleotidyltransferase domain-containing protein [Spirochaetia bacterium]